MAKKQFKTESKKLLDMMINSIYTHKEIFLRELISNASDAIDKLYFRSLTDTTVSLVRGDYEIRIIADKAARTLEIRDNGCGMAKEELESNLGTIARSGSFDFKNGDEPKENADKIDIIGQFGVGFYSAFMVSEKITVTSRAYGSEEAYKWESEGVDGYLVEKAEKEGFGTSVLLKLRPDTDDEKYSEFLDEYRIKDLVRKYSDYIRYPIRMMVAKTRRKDGSSDDNPEYEEYLEDETLNRMIPIWKKEKSEVTDEEYNNFYKEKFRDYEDPVKVIRQKTEGVSDYIALLFIPARAPYGYYTRDFEKGLQLYSSGVLIMDKCKELLPDYFSFVKGLVDSADLSLNISREMLQHDRQLKIIAKALEKKIKDELQKMLENERDKYKEFFREFGTQIKYGVYADFGVHKETLKDLMIFSTSMGDEPTTLKEYVSRMKDDQKKIYFAVGDSREQAELLPQVEAVTAKGYEVLYLTEDVDEFAFMMLHDYDGKEFLNVSSDELDLGTDEEKESLKAENEAAKEMLGFMKDAIGDDISAVRFTNSLKDHPACLSSEGALSASMEKTLGKMPGQENAGIKAEKVLEINSAHPIADKLRKLYDSDREKLNKYAKILYANARLISGLAIQNPSEIGELVTSLMIDE
ncbi:MAG: molecular chaperone HtpG [Clostridiales bacterium]|nr:molecular chaperone HtpG [Clostridiales bacterium]